MDECLKKCMEACNQLGILWPGTESKYYKLWQAAWNRRADPVINQSLTTQESNECHSDGGKCGVGGYDGTYPIRALYTDPPAREDIIRIARESGFVTGARDYQDGSGSTPYVQSVATSTILPELESFANAILQSAAKTPEGWQLVPRDPTEAMREVIRNEHTVYDSEDELYRAMLNAAPKWEAEKCS